MQFFKEKASNRSRVSIEIQDELYKKIKWNLKVIWVTKSSGPTGFHHLRLGHIYLNKSAAVTL